MIWDKDVASAPTVALGYALSDPSCDVISPNSPRAGRQQGQESSDGCARGPLLPGDLRRAHQAVGTVVRPSYIALVAGTPHVSPGPSIVYT